MTLLLLCFITSLNIFLMTLWSRALVSSLHNTACLSSPAPNKVTSGSQKKKKDGNDQNAKLKASEWQSTNQWVRSQWLHPLLKYNPCVQCIRVVWTDELCCTICTHDKQIWVRQMPGSKIWLKAFQEERRMEMTKKEQLHFNACGFTMRCSLNTIMGAMFQFPHTFGHELHVFF